MPPEVRDAAPVLTIIAGPNGSGKSSLTRSLDFKGRENLLDPDAIARQINPDDIRAASILAGRAVLTRTRQYLQDRTSFAIETTLSSKKTLTTLQQARDLGFQTHLVYVCLDDPEMNLLRVQERFASGGHDVPEDDVRRRYGRSLTNVADVVRIVDVAVLFDNTGRQHRMVLESKFGRITWQAASLPAWAAQILTQL